MVILSSPSGAGKTTLVKLLSKNKNFNISVSHTTRKPRLNEIANKDYYFIDNNKFEEVIKDVQAADNSQAHDCGEPRIEQIILDHLQAVTILPPHANDHAQLQRSVEDVLGGAPTASKNEGF